MKFKLFLSFFTLSLIASLYNNYNNYKKQNSLQFSSTIQDKFNHLKSSTINNQILFLNISQSLSFTKDTNNF